MSITIQEISGTRGLKKFAKFPINLYKGNEYYVPSLVLDEVGTLNSKKQSGVRLLRIGLLHGL